MQPPPHAQSRRLIHNFDSLQLLTAHRLAIGWLSALAGAAGYSRLQHGQVCVFRRLCSLSEPRIRADALSGIEFGSRTSMSPPMLLN